MPKSSTGSVKEPCMDILEGIFLLCVFPQSVYCFDDPRSQFSLLRGTSSSTSSNSQESPGASVPLAVTLLVVPGDRRNHGRALQLLQVICCGSRGRHPSDSACVTSGSPVSVSFAPLLGISTERPHRAPACRITYNDTGAQISSTI